MPVEEIAVPLVEILAQRSKPLISLDTGNSRLFELLLGGDINDNIVDRILFLCFPKLKCLKGIWHFFKHIKILVLVGGGSPQEHPLQIHDSIFVAFLIQCQSWSIMVGNHWQNTVLLGTYPLKDRAHGLDPRWTRDKFVAPGWHSPKAAGLKGRWTPDLVEVTGCFLPYPSLLRSEVNKLSSKQNNGGASNALKAGLRKQPRPVTRSGADTPFKPVAIGSCQPGGANSCLVQRGPSPWALFLNPFFLSVSQ